MDTGLKVSILMPVYNGQKYLKEAIESILNQTFGDFEFLIINDGSTDKSEKIIEEFEKKDKRIKYIKNEKNQGLIKTLNKGLQLAKGEYIIRMDCDDVSSPERVERQVKFLDENKNVGVLGCWFDFIGISSEIKWPVSDEDIKIQLFHRTAIGHPTVAIRKSVLTDNNIAYDVNFPHAEDYNLWVDLLKLTSFANYPEKLFHYRPHRNQVSIVHRDIQDETVRSVRLKALRLLIDDFSDAEADLHLSLLNERFGHVDFGEARLWLERLIEANDKKKIFNSEKFNIFINDIISKIKEPLVSIIIPAYNNAEFIPETLDCLVNQCYKNWEAVIVDDGSSDNTEKIVNEYVKTDRRFRYFKQKNQGTSVARNVGLKKSQGEYIQFLDADDFISSDKLSEEIIIFNKNNGVEIIYSDYICFANEDKQKKWTYSRVLLDVKDPLLDLAQNWEKDLSIPIHCFLYKKYCLESINGFDESLAISHEDWDLHLKLAEKKYKFLHHEHLGAFYRVCLTKKSRGRDESATKRGKKIMLKKFINNKDMPYLIRTIFFLRSYEDLFFTKKVSTILFKLKNSNIVIFLRRVMQLILNPKLFVMVMRNKYYSKSK